VAERQPMVNLSVAEAHTFFVGDAGWLVHNGRRGRGGKQARLRELANDDKQSSAFRGWICQEINAMARDRAQRPGIRVPPGTELAHRRGYEARKGYDYSNSDLCWSADHKNQHSVESRRRKR
jgi:hypothetical protein